MSIRTIIEINHDYCHDIDGYPEMFLAYLVQALRSSSTENWQLLEHYGITVVSSHHHSADRKVVVEGREFKVG